LRILLDRHTGTLQPLRRAGYLVRIKQTLDQPETLFEIEQRVLDGGFEIQRIIRMRLEHTMEDKPHFLRVPIPRNRNNGGAVVFHRRINADIDQ